ncbi:beta strand repeat-containing protein [Terracidiphilus gabretensis]|uniref:beta strand repeat-containing protein n=1 Tax=Terracidiphilus gabretensis TaxID=1577687 RepID=UPI00071B29D0|nr:choice-of-anchor D domain-containing protein [Terracidiphilus gabretensis]
MRVFIIKVFFRAGVASLCAVFCLAILFVYLAQTAAAQTPVAAPAPTHPLPPRVLQAQRFLGRRGLKPGMQSKSLRPRRAASALASPEFAAGESIWQPLGPQSIVTPYYGAVTGRIASIAIDPSDSTGNTVYIGSTGGGVWASQNAATSNLANILFSPLTDSTSALNGAFDPSISIGAVTVQPGGTGVLLAGTGDPNDALDSYYGAGILRSTDKGATWTLIEQSSDFETGAGSHDFLFTGLGFAGFAWSTANTQVAVAAVSEAYEGLLVNAQQPGLSFAGLYYSGDAGATWHLSRIVDPNGVDVQGPDDSIGNSEGNSATAVVWNPIRKLFFTAIRYHGYYQSADGVTWTRLANQPGVNLTTTLCPTNATTTGSPACPIFRGALAVNPLSGDTFAWSVDLNNQDQGLWQDACAISGGACPNPIPAFGTQLSTALLESNTSQGPQTIWNGDYNFALAAIPSQQDTLLYAGANDLWKCSVAAGCPWRNTTNALTCLSAQVGPYQHALTWNPANPTELLIGNDSGLWRSLDGIGETGSVCASTDASHFQNLNSSLGSLAEIEFMPPPGLSPYNTLLGLSVNGTAGVKGASAPTAQWPQILSGEGGPVAIDPSSSNNWYVNNGAGVSIHLCSSSSACTASDFGLSPVVGNSQVANDGLTMTTPAPFLVDPADPTQLLIGTCRIWRGPANGSGWTSSNAISPILDTGSTSGYCNGDALIRTLAAMPLAGDGEVVYAGMYGFLDGGARLAGEVFSATMSSTGVWSAWTNLSLNPVVNGTVGLNAFQFDISSIVIDPSDPTGNTVYITVDGFPTGSETFSTIYRSTDSGAHWYGLISNLETVPVNALAIDPNDPNTVYVATDFGVYATRQISSCATLPSTCWQPMGAGLPGAPAVALGATPAASSTPVLVAATYGRGLWQIPLLTAGTELTSASLSPSSLTFAAQSVGSSSSPQTITVKNTGGFGLSITSVSVSGSFLENDDCTGQEIVAGSSCTVQVFFVPTATGSATGQLTVSGSITGGSLTASLTGTGIPAGSVTIAPGVLAFGDVEVGSQSSAQSLTAQNANSTPLTVTSLVVTPPFVLISNGCGASIAPTSDCALSVGFNPTAAGSANGTLTMSDGAGTQVVQLTGSGTTPPTDALSPSSLSFSGTVIDQPSSAQTVTLANTGQNILTGISISISGPFQQTTSCAAQLAAQSTCPINVVFVPTAAGSATGTLTVADGLRTQTVSLTGTGLNPPVISVSSTAFNFGQQPAGVASSSQTLTVTNTGGASMANIGFQITGASSTAFSVASTTCGASLNAGSSCVAQIVFTPTAIGGASASLAVSSSTTGVSAATVSLNGNGTGVGLKVTPAQLTFAAQELGQTSAAQTVTITNTSGAAATGFSLAVSSSFGLTGSTCPSSLAGGATCAVGVTFTPESGGPITGQLSVNSTWALAPATISLAGTGGLNGAVQFKPSSIAFPVVGVGQTSAATTVTITNVDPTNTLSSLNLSASFGYALVSNTCGSALAPNASCTVGVEFEPIAAGPATGNLIVSSPMLGSPAMIPLTGTGFDFTVAADGPSSVTVASGQTAGYALTITPLGGISASFAFQCGTLPQYAGCTSTPATLSVAAGASGTETVDITTSQTTGALSLPSRSNFRPNPRSASHSGSVSPFAALCCVLLLLPLAALRRFRRAVLLAAVIMLSTCVVNSCSGSGGGGDGKGGGGSGGGGGDTTNTTPAGTYTIPVQVTANGVQHSISLTLVVD